MTFEDAEKIVKNIKYKAGWQFKLHKDSYIKLEIVYRAFDVVSGETGKFGNYEIFTEKKLTSTNQKVFLNKIESMIKNLEEHEFKEWFKYKNETVYDPHPELKKVA